MPKMKFEVDVSMKCERRPLGSGMIGLGKGSKKKLKLVRMALKRT